jgi:hypothetical protein
MAVMLFPHIAAYEAVALKVKLPVACVSGHVTSQRSELIVLIALVQPAGAVTPLMLVGKVFVRTAFVALAFPVFVYVRVYVILPPSSTNCAGLDTIVIENCGWDTAAVNPTEQLPVMGPVV